MNKSSGNGILDVPGTLQPGLPSTLDPLSFPRQSRGIDVDLPEPRGLPAPWRVEDYLQAASERSASHVRTRRLAR